MHRKSSRWLRGRRAFKDPVSVITTAIFVVILGFVVGTFLSIGPLNSMRRLMQGYDSAISFVVDLTSSPGRIRGGSGQPAGKG